MGTRPIVSETRCIHVSCVYSRHLFCFLGAGAIPPPPKKKKLTAYSLCVIYLFFSGTVPTVNYKYITETFF